MELRAASIRLARQILCFRLNIQRIHDNGREPRYRVCFIHASASSSRMNHRQRRPLSPDRTYQSSTLNRPARTSESSLGDNIFALYQGTTLVVPSPGQMARALAVVSQEVIDIE